jgi:hypothetical protein
VEKDKLEPSKVLAKIIESMKSRASFNEKNPASVNPQDKKAKQTGAEKE